MKPDGTITFFYYQDTGPAAAFYADMPGFELVEDQGWAKIYRVSEGAYLGIVDGSKGSLQPREENAVLLTLVVDDVEAWYKELTRRGAPLWKDLRTIPDIGVRCFFITDPGGYKIEVQQFLEPETAKVFRARTPNMSDA